MIFSSHISLYVAGTGHDMAEQAALIMEEQCSKAVSERGVFNLAISGGKTPLELFDLLATPEWIKRMDWEHTAIYWVDEHDVSPDDEGSNYRRARNQLLSRVPVTRYYRIKGEEGPIKAAESYENLLRDHFCLMPGEAPRFDCIILGVGDDGRVASLRPGSPAVLETERLVVDQYVQSQRSSRITMTFQVLNAAHCCLIMASGAGKHKVLGTALNLMAEPVLPIQKLRPFGGKVCWVIDEAAYKGQ